MEISSKQREVLDFMVRYQEDKGYPPSVREICSAVGLSSTSTVHGHLSRLEAKGYIRRDPSKPRAIEIVRRPEHSGSIFRPTQTNRTETFASLQKANSANAYTSTERTIPFQNPRYGQNLVAVPIIGRIRAGEPILAVENIQDYFPLPVEATGNSECFMLRVQGESMIKAGIFEGDLILVRIQRSAANRDIVVALLGDSVTVKTYYKEKDYVRLQPENDYMDAILIKDCTILGKVIGLYRSF
ncbi:MAG: transcriptional repressor LexA [Lachnospiraceae bacterium]|nr:transcriptional repressor LexA [Lachnospiraceae bacterium]